jgi:hypothetical protein
MLFVLNADFEQPMNASSHFVLLSAIFVMTIILSFSDTASLSSALQWRFFMCHC